MIVVRGDMSQAQPIQARVALSMGNFDGVHRGHKFLVEQLKNKAHAHEVQSALLTFHPHPMELLDPKGFMGYLLTEEKKITNLEKLGVDYLFIQDFSRGFSQVECEDFLRQYLLRCFNPEVLVFGYDFHFGRGGRGDFLFVQEQWKKGEVYQAQPLYCDGKPLSSSKIRQFLSQADIVSANEALGYHYSIQGQVVKGQGLGRKIGFPTANLQNIQTLVPSQGVYAGYVKVEGAKKPAVLNIGVRPTINDFRQLTCECHILDFSQDLYGVCLDFAFLDKIRDEKKFSGIDELSQQIITDVKQAREVFQKYA